MLGLLLELLMIVIELLGSASIGVKPLSGLLAGQELRGAGGGVLLSVVQR